MHRIRSNVAQCVCAAELHQMEFWIMDEQFSNDHYFAPACFSIICIHSYNFDEEELGLGANAIVSMYDYLHIRYV